MHSSNPKRSVLVLNTLFVYDLSKETLKDHNTGWQNDYYQNFRQTKIKCFLNKMKTRRSCTTWIGQKLLLEVQLQDQWVYLRTAAKDLLFLRSKQQGSRQSTHKFYSKNFMVSKLWPDRIISLPIPGSVLHVLQICQKTEINNLATNQCKSSF